MSSQCLWREMKRASLWAKTARGSDNSECFRTLSFARHGGFELRLAV